MTTTYGSIEINEIRITESLGENDTKTGRNIFDDMRWELEKVGIRVQYHPVSTKQELEVCLSDLVNESAGGTIRPVIQFETHGSERGLSTADGETMSWEEVSKYLVKINVNCRNNLIVLMLSCYGANLLKIFTKSPVAPFRCDIGPV